MVNGRSRQAGNGFLPAAPYDAFLVKAKAVLDLALPCKCLDPGIIDVQGITMGTHNGKGG